LGNLFSGCRIRRPEFVWFHLRRFWHQPLLGSERERRKVIYNFAGRGSRYRGQDKLNRQGSFMKWVGSLRCVHVVGRHVGSSGLCLVTA
jgi:hypothetical protein